MTDYSIGLNPWPNRQKGDPLSTVVQRLPDQSGDGFSGSFPLRLVAALLAEILEAPNAGNIHLRVAFSPSATLTLQNRIEMYAATS
jgi:hypothetical protein